MKFTLNVRSIWEFGQRVDSAGKPHQEDSLYPEHGQATSDDRLFIVCDGMGGHEAGEVASAAVCQSMAATIDVPGKDSEGPFPMSQLKRAVSAAYDSLDCIPGGEKRKPGTTLALLKFHEGGVTIAHIGDSRVYHIRPGKDEASTKILFQTSDHSLVNELVKLGELTPEQARVSPQRNVITRAMQPRLNPRPEADVDYITDIRPGDYFYVCSDGMLEQADDKSLRALFAENKSIDSKVAALIADTVHNQDNHTAILVEVTGVEQGERPQTSMVSTADAIAAARAQAIAEMQSEKAKEAPAQVVRPTQEMRSAAPSSEKKSKAGWIALVIVVAILAAAAVWIFAFPKQATEVKTSDTVIIEAQSEQPAESESYQQSEDAYASPESRQGSTPAPAVQPQGQNIPQTQEVNPPAHNAPATPNNPSIKDRGNQQGVNDAGRNQGNKGVEAPQQHTTPTPPASSNPVQEPTLPAI